MARPFAPAADGVVGIDDEEADAVLDALSTDSARRILVALDDGPATVGELAERTHLTAQNVSYHLDKLTVTDLVRTAGTRGTGGNEATVYARSRRLVVSTGPTVWFPLRPGIVGLLTGGLLAITCLV